jgi:hypothetical protein
VPACPETVLIPEETEPLPQNNVKGLNGVIIGVYAAVALIAVYIEPVAQLDDASYTPVEAGITHEGTKSEWLSRRKPYDFTFGERPYSPLSVNIILSHRAQFRESLGQIDFIEAIAASDV